MSDNTDLIAEGWHAHEEMWNTSGQDQWPCDLLRHLLNELRDGKKSYSTKNIEKSLPDVPALTVHARHAEVIVRVAQRVLEQRNRAKR